MGFKSLPQTTMLLSTVSSLAVISLAVAAPQYGGVQPSRQVSPSSVQCRVETTVIWDTQSRRRRPRSVSPRTMMSVKLPSRDSVNPLSDKSVVYEKECRTVYKEVCVEQYKTEYEPYTETVCSTLYKDDCEYQWQGEGNNKVWVPIPGTCKKNPYDECRDVTKTKERQVATPCVTRCRSRVAETCRDKCAEMFQI